MTYDLCDWCGGKEGQAQPNVTTYSFIYLEGDHLCKDCVRMMIYQVLGEPTKRWQTTAIFEKIKSQQVVSNHDGH